MNFDADSDDYIEKIYRNKGKCALYARRDFHVEMKPKCNANARTLVKPTLAEGIESIGYESGHHVWFQIAMRLDPEDVQSFALVCKQFSRLVSARVFWRNMYKRHCLPRLSGAKKLELPAHLHMEQIYNCDTKVLRSRVIEVLFHCYEPLQTRLQQGYNLNWVLQRRFIACSQKQYHCLWVTFYTLHSRLSPPALSRYEVKELAEESVESSVANNWEELAEADDGLTHPVYNQGKNPEGVLLLMVFCKRFTPLPLQLLYNQQQTRFRLRATRELLCTDMRAKNLELDFGEENSQLSLTVKYSQIEKYKVIPWWDPDFKRFLKVK